LWVARRERGWPFFVVAVGRAGPGRYSFQPPARLLELLSMMPDNEFAEQSPIGFGDVHRVVLAAESAGWPTKAGFECALLMLCNGVSVAGAERAFLDAARRIQ
jgi:hypothetical protein